MTRHYPRRTISLGCLLLALTRLAGAGMVQCIDVTGTVTYTDIPCRDARDSDFANPAAIKAETPSPAENFTAAENLRESAWAKKSVGKRRPATDVTTVKAARSSMLLKDQAWSLSRQKKWAALDRQDRHWFNF